MFKAFCTCVATHAMHDTRCAGPKSCSYLHLIPLLAIQMASNCWLLALNVGVAHWLLHIIGKVHGGFILVKKQ